MEPKKIIFSFIFICVTLLAVIFSVIYSMQAEKYKKSHRQKTFKIYIKNPPGTLISAVKINKPYKNKRKVFVITSLNKPNKEKPGLILTMNVSAEKNYFSGHHLGKHLYFYLDDKNTMYRGDIIYDD